MQDNYIILNRQTQKDLQKKNQNKKNIQNNINEKDICKIIKQYICFSS